VANDMIILDGRREGMAYNAEEPEEEWANPPEPAPVARPAARPAAPARSNGNGNGGNTAPAKAPARSAAPAATQTRPASRKPVVTDEDDLPF